MLHLNASRPNLLPALACLAALFACLIRPAFADDRPIRIGGTLSLTGRHASVAKYQENGFRLWVRDINKQGGILGRPVELVLFDDRSDPRLAEELYRRLIVKEQVDLLFAPYTSDITAAVLELTAKQGYPLIISGASADRIWEKGYKNVFGLFLPSSRFTVGFQELLLRNGIDRLAILYDDSTFSQDLAAGARTWAGRFGLTVVLDEQFPRDRPEFRFLARKARAAGARVVILASYLAEAVAMRRAFTAIGWKPSAYYAPVGPGTAEYVRALGAEADGVFSTSQWAYEIRGREPRADAFVKAYRSRFRQDPSYFAATAYASGEILAAAVKRVGTLDREAVRRALLMMDENSVIGRYGVDRTGLQVKNVNLIIQRQHGKKEVVWPPGYRTAAPKFP